ncbi:UNVERIFIED_CONTAM: hypothetical protein Slati_2681200 [Sesamum latifolium]|uniref:Aminotransferase-like plant mobile domain-containing protein n=1 Tax=Sesamum latifolium TaxID=2727402 RepID=A0AAW2VWX4_9LAMI
MVQTKLTHNPLGDIATLKRWSTADEALFEGLCIKENLKEEVYLAALACWLCTFVLPGKDVNSIRPSTFKMASMMASGRQMNLAIPILGSIYKGLNTITTSSRPAHTSPSFPIHFVYAWLASYFKTHYPVWQGLRGPKMMKFSGEGSAKYYDPREARKRIHKAEFVSWTCNMIEDKQVDDGKNNPPHVFVPSTVVKCNTQAVVAKVSKGKGPSHNLADSDSSNKDRHWKSLSDQQLKEAENHLQDAQTKASEETSKVQSTMDKLERIEKEIMDLKRPRTSLCATLRGQKQLDHDAQAKVHEIEEDIATLENTTPLNDAIVEDLESSRANLKVLKEDLKSLNSFA